MVKSDLFFLGKEIFQVWNKQALKKDAYLFCTDSRVADKDCAFVAIKGAQHDAFSFIENLLNEVTLIVFESSDKKNEAIENLSKRYPGVCFVSVNNSVKYIQNLAKEHSAYCSKKEEFKFIAISGSNGKTTTKEMLFHFLNSVAPGKVIATQKNDNNHLGVPFTILRINPNIHTIGIIEFGSNHPGEMQVLCDLTHPNSGLITNIGFTHMEFFKTLKDVFNEESSIFYKVKKHTNEQGFFLVNLDDENLKELKLYKNAKTFSTSSSDCDFLYKISSDSVEVGEHVLKNDQLIGDYNFINLANAFLLAKEIFPKKAQELERASLSFVSKGNRSEWISWRGAKVFLDAYNANPSSMSLAIKAFLDFGTKQTPPVSNMYLVLGDMNELGENAEHYHFELGRSLSKVLRDGLELAFIGKYQKSFSEGLGQAKYSLFSSSEEFMKSSFYSKMNNGLIFAKASRSLHFERIFDINTH